MYCVAVAIFILSLLLNCISISMRGTEHRFVINMMLLWKLNNIRLLFTYIYIYRVAALSCPEEGGCKSAIHRGFPDVFSLFGP